MKHLQLIENQVNKIITGVLCIKIFQKCLIPAGASFAH